MVKTLVLTVCVLSLVLGATVAAAGIKHSHLEDFTTATYKDPATTAWWDTGEGKLALPPVTPDIVGGCAIPGDALDIAVDGDYAYVAAGTGGLRVLDVSHPGTPSVAASYGTVASARALLVDGNFVYIAVGASGLQVIDIINPLSPAPAALEPTHAPSEDLALFGDYLLVAAGTGGVEVYDVSNPRNPVYVETVWVTGAAHAVLVDGNHAYAACGSDGVYAIDLRTPTSPGLLGWCDTPGDARDLALVGDCLFVADGAAGVSMLDVATVAHPAVLGTFPTAAATLRVALDGERLYVAEGTAGVEVFDCRDPGSVSFLGLCDTPGNACGLALAGRHLFVSDGTQGACVVRVNELVPMKRVDVACLGTVYDVAVEGYVAYIAEWGPYRIKIMDVSNPEQPVLVGYTGTVYPYGLTISGDLLLVAGSDAGIRIMSIADPLSPVLLGSCGTAQYARDIAVVGTTALVTEFGAGLTAVDISDPSVPLRVKTVAGAGRLEAIAIAGDYAFVSGQSGAYLTVFDIRDPRNPIRRNYIPLGGPGFDLAVSGNWVFVAAQGSLEIFDISEPELPVKVGSYYTPGYAYGVTVDGDRLYIADYQSGILVLDITDPVSPILLATLDTPAYAMRVERSGDCLYVADNYDASIIRIRSGQFAAADNFARSTELDTGSTNARKVRLSTQSTGTTFTWDVTANAGTNWQTVAANGLWTDLANPGPDLLWRAGISLDDPDVNPTCTELKLDWLYEVPILDAVSDVPLDEGRRVRLTWTRNIHDFVGSAQPILQYAIYRRIEEGMAPGMMTEDAQMAAALRTGDDPEPLYPPGDWDFVSVVPARCEDTYSVIAPTISDSTLTGGPHLTTFFVSAMTATPGVYFDSPPEGGYSVDNLAPLAPEGFAVDYSGDGVNVLSWDPSPAADLLEYRIYRAETPDFEPGSENQVDATRLTTWTDEIGLNRTYTYGIAAVDSAGNVGEAVIYNPTILGAELPVATTLLAQNTPNPFSRATTIRFALDDPAPVSLDVFDAGGRRVRTLANAAFPAGEHVAVWNGDNDRGDRVVPGVYFYRIRAGNRTETRRLIFLP